MKRPTKTRATPMPLVGDPHNFGRRVEIRGDRIHKPRTLLWEWLLLAAESPLRAVLAKIGGGADVFGFLPDLAFSRPLATSGGEVDRVRLEPLAPDVDPRAVAAIAGRAIALFSWLGLSDLHWENLALGMGTGGRVIFAPLDVELVLDDLELPTDTKLLPDADPDVAAICQHACGARRLLPFLGKPVTGPVLVEIAAGYRAAIALLDKHAAGIAEAIASVPGVREAPIRVLLRGTDAYVEARHGRPSALDPPLLEAEAEQLARGDIPYFFRLYGRPEIRWFADASLEEIATLPLEGDVPRLGPLLSLEKGLRSPNRKKLREEGLVAVIGAFDHPSIKGQHASGDLAVSFRGKSLLVELGKHDELETPRDLSDYVASVYSPCSCGEVRTVFVPAVTACDAPPRGTPRGSLM